MSLPVCDFEQVIAEAIMGNRVTIITADTGAGKSTQVPQFLLRRGISMVVTEPRRLAARSVAKRVAEEYGCALGEEVGYRTGYDRKDSAKTRCLFATDGLELVREIHANWKPQVLVIDEVHEWNINIETLVAWSKKRLADDPSFRVVIMSATLEADRLAAFFGNAPIIDVPGRLFPIETRSASEVDLPFLVETLVKDGRNVLVFQPGKKEIGETIDALTELQVKAEILPLHGEMDPEDQDKVFRHYARPKVVVATNIAQTSVTIDDIDAVIDSGKERRIETVAGIEGLYLRRTARSDDKQRQGRAGRCKPGVYYHCNPYEMQLEFPVAEIQRVRLDQLVLRLAIHGFDATQLEFFHQPDQAALSEAKRALHALGAIDELGQVTAIGQEMAKMPISVEYARMVIEAKKLGVLDDVLTIAACLEVKGINSNHPDDEMKWKFLAGRQRSDLLAQLELYRQAQDMSKEEMRSNGVSVKSFYQAADIRKKLAESLIIAARENRQWIEFDSSGDPAAILRACVAGMVDHLYRVRWGMRGPECVNGDNKWRKVSDRTIVSCNIDDWIVGLPIDIQSKNKRTGTTRIINLVTMITLVEPQTLAEIAPQLMQRERCNFRLANGLVAFDDVVLFNGTALPGGETIECSWDELDHYLEGVATCEQVRQYIISKQLAEAMSYLGVLDVSGFIHGPEDVTAEMLRPKTFGYDPSNGQALKAYPAIVKGVIFWKIKYFLDYVEAQQAQIPYNREFELEAFNPLAKLGGIVTSQVDSQKEWKGFGGRNWLCPNGHSIKATKQATSVTCAICGASHKLVGV